MSLLSLMLSSCTWNASIKSLDDVSSASNSNQIEECYDDIATSTLCKVSQSGKVVTSTLGSNVTSWNNPTQSNTVTAVIPNGYYSGQMCSFQDINLVAANIKNGTTIFGVTGSYTVNTSFQTLMASSALRDPGIEIISNLTGQTTSSQITLDSEQNTYAGIDLPTTGGYNYRDIPDVTKDDDGHSGTNCKYAPRPANDCGTTQNTIVGRIIDCAAQNPLTSTWNGATQCNGGEGVWKLVTRNGANKEVWQDQRTGQLWSSTVASAINWCQASGNTQEIPPTFINSFNNAAGTPIIGNGTIGSMSSGATSNSETITITFSDATTFTVTGTGGAGGCQGGAISGGLTTTAGSTATYSKAGECSFTLTQGSTNFAANDKFTLHSVANATYSCLPGAASTQQPVSPVSYCAEDVGVNEPAGENWGAGVYMAAKGGMGKVASAQSPSVRWRLPTIRDYNIANANGISFVMPDMGIAGTSRPSTDTSIAGNMEWASTVVAGSRYYAWYYQSNYSYLYYNFRNSSYSARCVGR